jgi:hypothetical protein
LRIMENKGGKKWERLLGLI